MLAKEQIQSTFGKNLNRWRVQHAQLSAEELAEIVNMTPAQIFSYERGATMPTIYSAYRLANVFGVGVDELMGNEEEL